MLHILKASSTSQELSNANFGLQKTNQYIVNSATNIELKKQSPQQTISTKATSIGV